MGIDRRQLRMEAQGRNTCLEKCMKPSFEPMACPLAKKQDLWLKLLGMKNSLEIKEAIRIQVIYQNIKAAMAGCT